MTSAGYEHLGRGESLDTLALANMGQLIVTRAAVSVAVPARYLVEGDRVLIHVLGGPEPVSWRDGEVMTLQASAFDAEQRHGWNVAVTGRAHGTPSLVEVEDPPSAPWIPTGGGDLIALTIELVQGERLGETTAPDAPEVTEPDGCWADGGT
jgi:hypothetical protein